MFVCNTNRIRKIFHLGNTFYKKITFICKVSSQRVSGKLLTKKLFSLWD